MSGQPEDLLGTPFPDLVLTSPDGAPYPLRQHVGIRPSVYFFYIRNGTPG